MRYSKWLGLAAAVLLIVSCFSPWVIIESRQITVSGVDTAGTNFGKPAYFHFFITFFYVICVMVPRIWAKRLNLVVAALNMGWALRNFILIPACQAGDCPLKQSGLWMVELASLFMLLAAVFPDMKLPVDKQNS
ncbi:MAG: hypothetical protein IPP93_11630 [Chitinophagaceae bacterium]|nr:hypothetical protein [Chitinophagaceae bacterium]